jgi:hypothetical protein
VAATGKRADDRGVTESEIPATADRLLSVAEWHGLFRGKYNSNPSHAKAASGRNLGARSSLDCDIH